MTCVPVSRAKTPLGAVRAFRKAFADDPSKHFALKISNFDSAPDQKRRFLREITGLRNVSIHQEIFSRRRIARLVGRIATSLFLYTVQRALVSYSPEAMQLGKAVVATNWSGNCEFMTPQNSALVDFKLVPAQDPEGTYNYPMQSWADPDIDHAADWLRRLAEYPELRMQLGKRAMEDVERTLSFSAYSKPAFKAARRAGCDSEPVRFPRQIIAQPS